VSINGYYYLHENGQLIYKPGTDCVADLRESDLVRMLWPMDPGDRMGAWRIVIEATALDANKERVSELAAKWHCDEADADEFAQRANIRLMLDGNAWRATGPGFEDLAVSPAGFGDTKLEAMADLAKRVGYHASKLWGRSFTEILERAAA